MTHPFASLGPAIIAALGDPTAIEVTRIDADSGAYANGIWISGDATTSTVPAVVQPSSPKEMRQVPENERTAEGISVWTELPLQASDVAQRLEADVITWSGRSWRVMVVEDWSAQAGYAKAIATRIGE